MRRLLLFVSGIVLTACQAPVSEDIFANLSACRLEPSDSVCRAPSQPLTGGASEETATSVVAGSTYAITSSGPGKRSFVVFTATSTGRHTLFVGAAAPAEVCDLDAVCSSTITDCGDLRRAAQFDMAIGEHYVIEVPPTTSAHPFLLHIAAPAAEPPPSALAFGDPTIYAGGTTPYYVTEADLDGDGDLDLAVSTPDDAGGQTTVDIMEGSGTGAFELVGQTMTSAPAETVASDFTGDGILDIAGLAFDGQGGLPPFLLTGEGSLRYSVTQWLNGRPFLERLGAGDFDEDGVIDLVAPYLDFSDAAAPSGFVIVGVPAFEVRQDENAFQGDMLAAIAGDFDGDGHQDVVASSRTTSTVRLYLGDGSGTVQFASELAPGGAANTVIAAADLDGDGASDLLAGHTDGVLTIHYGGATPFERTASVPNLSLGNIATGDFDGDGLVDIAAAGGRRIAIVQQSAAGFALAGVLDAPPTTASIDVAAGDVNGDGRADLVATVIGGVVVYLATP